MTSAKQLLALTWLTALLACSGADSDGPEHTSGSGGQAATTTTTSSTGGTGGGGTTTTPGSGGAGGGGECVPGQATFLWEAPNQREDGSCLTNLAGYFLLYGAESGDYTHRTDIPLDSTSCTDTTEENECGFIQECSVTIVGLTPQLWYFALVAYDTDGVESVPSNEVSKDLSCPEG
ncbi:MAG: hypothetical protein JRI23_15590 [Deltaproteobacteria bacterium]|jgi:hypothetical protein|nr:hypothetical protein [Deltaproteobacteria bacterium]MBW2533176.1 hypothetical protein [Deltaproteobacteria bacterium]